MQSELKTFINSNPDPRELKRALAVQMVQQGYAYRDIQAVLQVSLGSSLNGNSAMRPEE
jgi:hypothetical protein